MGSHQTIQKNFNLKDHNTFGIAVSAAHFLPAHSNDSILEGLAWADEKNEALMILGGGSNVLFTQDVQGLVLQVGLNGISVVDEDAEHVWIKVAAGENWHRLVLHCIQNNWGGIENMSLIPGNAGTAPMQNIGAYGVEIKDVFHSLEALEIETGGLRTFSNAECQFGYRESVFKNIFKNKYIITSITLRLTKTNHKLSMEYGAIQSELEKLQIEQPTISDISKAVINIRESKLPNPATLGNAGSFFKNPIVDTSLVQEIKSKYPEMPTYPVNELKTKVPAGWLIEQCGWKGKVVGNTGSHAKQALVLVNYGNASGSEIWKLAMDIKKSVADQFGIEIQPEVNII